VLAYCRELCGPILGPTAANAALASYAATTNPSGGDGGADQEPLLRSTRLAAARAELDAARQTGWRGAVSRALVAERDSHCADTPVLIATRSNHELDAAAAERLDEHLSSCLRCRAAQLRADRAERAFAAIIAIRAGGNAPAELVEADWAVKAPQVAVAEAIEMAARPQAAEPPAAVEPAEAPDESEPIEPPAETDARPKAPAQAPAGIPRRPRRRRGLWMFGLALPGSSDWQAAARTPVEEPPAPAALEELPAHATVEEPPAPAAIEEAKPIEPAVTETPAAPPTAVPASDGMPTRRRPDRRRLFLFGSVLLGIAAAIAAGIAILGGDSGTPVTRTQPTVQAAQPPAAAATTVQVNRAARHHRRAAKRKSPAPPRLAPAAPAPASVTPAASGGSGSGSSSGGGGGSGGGGSGGRGSAPSSGGGSTSAPSGGVSLTQQQSSLPSASAPQQGITPNKH
jgi:hypothetical protein